MRQKIGELRFNLDHSIAGSPSASPRLIAFMLSRLPRFPKNLIGEKFRLEQDRFDLRRLVGAAGARGQGRNPCMFLTRRPGMLVDP